MNETGHNIGKKQKEEKKAGPWAVYSFQDKYIPRNFRDIL